jgi:hypothetical protein
MTAFVAQFIKQQKMNAELIPIHYLRQYSDQVWVVGVGFFTIQINQPTRCNSFTSLLPHVYVWLDMFRASPRPSSRAYSCIRSLRFYRRKEAAGALLVVVWPARPRPTTNLMFMGPCIVIYFYSKTS